jgi:acyl-CoA thioester hydrolase
MARVDRAKLATAPFPVVLKLETRFDDVDTLGHINNAASVVLLQEGRARFNMMTDMPLMPKGYRQLLVGMNIEYALELRYPLPVEVLTFLTHVGRSSFGLGQILRQDGSNAVFAETTMVMADDQGATPIPEAMRAAMERAMNGAAPLADTMKDVI